MQGSLITGTSGFGAETTGGQGIQNQKGPAGLTGRAVANSERVSSKTWVAATDRTVVDDGASRVNPADPSTRIHTLVVDASLG